MTGTLLVVHGTGVRDVDPLLRLVRAGAERHLGWPADRVQAIAWGREIGPPDLDVRPALPPAPGFGGRAEDALWDVLLADPLAELRLLAGRGDDDARGELPARLGEAPLPAGDAVHATALDAARGALAGEPALAAAGDAHAAARAVVATALQHEAQAAREGALLPPAARDPAAREQLVSDLAAALGAGAPSAGDRAAPLAADVTALLGPLGEHLAAAKRAALMGPLSDFIRDVLWYFAHGEALRAVIARDVRRHHERAPVVLLAHSLGGIAAVDLLSDPDVMGGADPPRVDLLVTAGSQAPYVHLLGALHALRPGIAEPRPFQPWLNVFDRRDLLAFVAERVWPDAPGITDAEVEQGLPFPLAHDAYWAHDPLYALLREHLPG